MVGAKSEARNTAFIRGVYFANLFIKYLKKIFDEKYLGAVV